MKARMLAAAGAALAALSLPAAADASTVGVITLESNITVLAIVDIDGNQNNNPSVNYDSGFAFVTDGPGVVAGANCVQDDFFGPRVKCPLSLEPGQDVAAIVYQGEGGSDQLLMLGPEFPVLFDGGPGDDNLSVPANAEIEFDGGAGSDDATVSPGNATQPVAVALGDGNDTAKVSGGGAAAIDGGPGNDDLQTADSNGNNFLAPDSAEINGGDGDDKILVGDGKDTVRGGPGTDQVRYTDIHHSPGAATVTLDENADDGISGEGDNIIGVGPDAVENVMADMGAGNPVRIVGTDGPNDLRGDNINAEGRGGNDTIQGGDTIATERIDGGPGDDTLVGGFGPDVLIGGEGKDTFDGDRTQQNVVATGDDRIEARDGVVESIGCGVGADTAIVDAGDVTAPDCESVDRAAGPGGPGGGGIPGGGGGPGGGGAGALLRVTAPVSHSFRRSGRFVLVRRLEVRSVPANATVEVRCSGRGCPFAKRKLRRNSRGVASATSAFRRRRLAAGARIEVRITVPGQIGKVVRYAVKRTGTLRPQTLCLPPGGRVGSC